MVVRRSSDVMQLLTRAERLLARRLAALLEAEGHSAEAWRVITLLADGEGHFMTELSEQAFLPPASLTRLIDHLVEENLLYRRGDDVDRRRIRAHLTARGHRFHQRISAEFAASLSALPIDLGPIEGALGELIDGLEPVSVR
jgi:DNA-binding MarR family transcriptional regulator